MSLKDLTKSRKSIVDSLMATTKGHGGNRLHCLREVSDLKTSFAANAWLAGKLMCNCVKLSLTGQHAHSHLLIEGHTGTRTE